MNKPELLASMESSFNEMEQALSPLSETQWTTPGANGDWSVKDIVAHLTAWQHVMLRRLHAAARHETPARELQTEEKDIDDMNQRFYVENRDRPTPVVYDDFRASYHDIVAQIQSLPDADLFEVGRFDWTQESALWQYVAGDTFEHYDEHLPSIRDWVATHS
ncbi:MAG TPA: ClbS/DfsB family four-helix bundle protein [Ktedonobacteraceae bacterium]|nr:ClbS/DfsB family four-helix bundle protein [Ktedonobacteraceae bacterium]